MFSRNGKTGHAELERLLGIGKGPLDGKGPGATTPGIDEDCVRRGAALRLPFWGCVEVAGWSVFACTLDGRAEADIGGFCGLGLVVCGAASGLEELCFERLEGGPTDGRGKWIGPRL
jgi:hypothetical protein